MDDDLKIILTTELEADPKASAARIAKQLPEIEKLLNSLSKNLKLRVEIDEKAIGKQVQQATKQVQSQIDSMVNSRVLSFSKIFVGAGNVADKLSKTISSVVDETGRIVTTTKTLNLETREVESTQEKITSNYEKQRKEAEQLAKIAERDNASRMQFLTRQVTLLKNIYGNYSGATSTKGITDKAHLTELNGMYSSLFTRIQNLMAVTGKLSTEEKTQIQSLIADLNRLAKAYQNVEYSATDLRAKKVIDSVSKFKTDLAAYASQLKLSGSYTKEFRDRIDQLYAALNNVKNAEGLHNFQNMFAQLKSDVKLFNKEITASVKEFRLSESIKKADFELKKLKQDWSALFKNSNLRGQFDSLVAGLQNINSKADFDKWSAQMRTFKAEVKAAGLNTTALANSLKTAATNVSKVALLTFGFGSIYQTINTLKRSIQTIVDLDTAMIDLRKVTQGTEQQYEDFYHTANLTAKQLNATTESVIQQTANWARLGYSLQEATRLSQNSMIFAAISPGMDQERAMDGLVSVIKAYKVELDDVMNTMSEINEVGNNFALNNADIVESLTRSSSAMAAANNTFEETVALVTAATEIVRDPSSVGNGLKTLSMRLRAIDEETEEYSEDLAILTGAIADLTKTDKTPGGVSLFEPGDPNTYRSTYEILSDIADIWDEINDKSQARLLETMFGKRQAQIGSAILSNFDAARRAMETMENSAGSAEREMGKIIQSLQYQVNALKETWVGIGQNLFKKGDMKAFISFLQGVSSFLDFITDKIGILGTVAISGLIVKLVLLRKEMGLINREAIQLALMNPTTWIFAALIAIPGLMMLYDKLHKTQQELYTDAENLRDEYITSQEEIKKLEEEHAANLERIEELGSKGYNSLNIAEQEELNTLRLTNAELELQIAKRKELNNITDDAVNRGYQRAFNANSFQTLSGKIIGAQINSLRENNSDLLNRYADYQSGIGNISVTEIEEAESILGRIDELQHNITTNSVDYVTHVSELIETYNDLNSKLEKGEELSSAEKQLLLDTKTELLNLSNDLEDNYINKYIGTDDFKESLIDLRDQIDATVLPLEFFKSKLDGILSDSAKERLDSLIQSGEVTADVIDTLAQRFPELAHVIDLCGFSTEKLAEYFNSLQSSSEGAAAILDPWQQTLNTFDAVTNSMKKFTDIQEAVANGFIITAEKAREFAEVYPEILAAATTTADGQIQLNEDVVTNFLNGKQAELDADIDVQISKLQGEKAVLEAKKAGAEAQLELANAVAEGEGDMSQKLAQYRLELQNKLVEQFIQLGADEVTANKLAAEAMAQNEKEFDKVATEVFKNMATNADTAAYNSAQSIYENAVQAVNSLVSIGQQAYQTAVAVAGATEGLSNAVPQANLSQLRRGQGAAFQVGKMSVSGGGKRLGIGAFNRATSDFKGQDASFVQRSVDFDSFTNDLNLQIADFNAKIAQIDSQIALLESLRNRVDNSFDGTGTGSDTGGSGNKGGSGSNKAAKKIEEYVVSIDEYREALKRLAEAQSNVANIQKRFDNSISYNERIELQRQLVDAYKEEQEALHNLNNQRDTTINATVDALRELGFVVQYNADSNDLWIENMDHVNELVAESAGEYETLDEATNALRKDTETMIKTIEDLNKENQEASKQWWEDYSNIYEAYKKILDEAKQSVDDIQGYYDTLKNAAQEYAETGYINVDTLQKICEAGLENLAYLQDENGQLVINEESIQKVIAARTEQMAVETALNYVQQIRKALTEGDTEALNKLVFATESATTSTWDLVYAQLASLGLTDDQYNAAKQRIDDLRSLSDLAISSIGQMGKSLKETLQDSADALSDILKYVEEMIKQEVQNQIDALETQISDYQKIIDAQKKSLDLEREKNNYTKKITNKTKEIAQLQQKIAMLELDDSREAQAEKMKLQEQLANANEELADEQADKAYDSTKDMLDNMAESYENEKKKEIKILEDSISSEEKLYQKALKRIEESGEGLLNELLSWNTEYGNELNSTIVSAWEAASAAVQEYGGYLEAVRQTQNQINSIENSGSSNVVGASTYRSTNQATTPSSTVDSKGIHSIVAEMKSNSGKWSANNDSATNSRLNYNNLMLASQLGQYGLGVQYNSTTGTWEIIRDDSNPNNVGKLLYSVYHSGGIAGDNGTVKQNEMLAKLEKGEIILTQGQQQSAFKLLDISETMLSRFGSLFQYMSSGYSSPYGNGAFGQLYGVGGFGGDNIEVNVPIQVYPLEKMTDGEIANLTKRIGDNTINRINDIFYKNGKVGTRPLLKS